MDVCGADASGRTPHPLSPQQRWFLAEADQHEWVSARMFAGAGKGDNGGRGSRNAITISSASAVLRRLRERGLLASDVNPAIFKITDAGRAELKK
jgi:hypothetical protein